MTAMANLTGLYKERYAKDIETLYTASTVFRDDVAFVPADQQNGLNFNQPVVMSPEQGFTYAAPSSTPSPAPMNAAVSMQMQNAVVAPFQMLARCVLDYETATRSIANRAFQPAALLQMTNVMEQAKTRLELSLLYGQEGFGVTSASAAVNATTTTVTFTAATWADATFGASLNSLVSFWTAAGVIIGAAAADQVFVITKISTAARTVTVTSTSAGATALVAAAAGASIFYFGARTSSTVFNEMPGLSKIIGNTGVLFGIDAAAYDLWTGNSVAVGGQLTFDKLNAAIAVAVGRGLISDVTVYVNPLTWGNLLNQQNALRHYDTSYSPAKAQNGSKSIEFYSQTGKLTIKVHPFVKPGDAFAVPVNKLHRVGSTDITFQVPGPGGKDKDMFQDLVDSAGYQYKLYSAQTLFCSSPAQLVKLTGIVNV